MKMKKEDSVLDAAWEPVEAEEWVMAEAGVWASVKEEAWVAAVVRAATKEVPTALGGIVCVPSAARGSRMNRG